jgi:Uma2 family endonuclease
MTQQAHPKRRYTVEEYLRFEAESPERHEYHDGEIVAVGELLAMAGGSLNHSLIIANVIRELGNRLRGTPCRVFDSSLRIRIPRKTLYAYPDVSVVCGPTAFDPDRSLGETILNPRLIVEVLSPGTEAYDRGKKFARYGEIDSFQEYVLVSQDTMFVETFFRQADSTWQFRNFSGSDGVARLRSVGADLSLAEVYAGVEFESDSPPA